MADLKTKSGVRLTNRRLEKLAEEAERGYDLSMAKPERIGPGRPSLAEGESPRISYRVPATLFDAASSHARAEGRTLSELAREALQRYLAG